MLEVSMSGIVKPSLHRFFFLMIRNKTPENRSVVNDIAEH
jgi:hypothetical protein